jgi:ribokinase
VRGVVCKAGDQGAYWIGETTTHVPTIAVRVVDSTAAGDAFNGALGCAVTERPILEAIRFANAAGALAATRHGAQPSLPRRADVDRLLTAAPSRPVGSPRSGG